MRCGRTAVRGGLRCGGGGWGAGKGPILCGLPALPAARAACWRYPPPSCRRRLPRSRGSWRRPWMVTLECVALLCKTESELPAARIRSPARAVRQRPPRRRHARYHSATRCAQTGLPRRGGAACGVPAMLAARRTAWARIRAIPTRAYTSRVAAAVWRARGSVPMRLPAQARAQRGSPCPGRQRPSARQGHRAEHELHRRVRIVPPWPPRPRSGRGLAAPQERQRRLRRRRRRRAGTAVWLGGCFPFTIIQMQQSDVKAHLVPVHHAGNDVLPVCKHV